MVNFNRRTLVSLNRREVVNFTGVCSGGAAGGAGLVLGGDSYFGGGLCGGGEGVREVNPLFD